MEANFIIVAGGASGIGLATVKLLLSLGAKVVSADINTPAVADGSLFVKTDVSSWSELASLFKKAKAEYGQIDFVFANAGIGPRANYLVLEAAENGDLLEPNATVLDINFKSVINTGALAVHYLKEAGGAIVIMASSTGIQPVRAPDYGMSRTTQCSIKIVDNQLTRYDSFGQGWYCRLWKESCKTC